MSTDSRGKPASAMSWRKLPWRLFQAGTRQTEQGLVTSGGRVLGVTASGATLPLAIDAAYRAVEQVHFAGMHYRRDIGRKGLARW